MASTKQVERELTRKRIKTKISRDMFLSTGSTVLNMAISGRPTDGYVKGKYYLWVGDSSSGKTFFTTAVFAEAAKNKHFADYRFIQDDTEDGALMNKKAFFGKKAAKRIEPPAGTRADPQFSSTLDEFYYNLDRALDKGPCIYVLDSMDAIQPEVDEEKFDEQKKAHERAKKTGKQVKVSGSYGMAKAKMNSNNIRRMRRKLKKTGSILIIVAQSRDNVGMFTMQDKTRAGGHALTFFATVEFWSSIRQHLKKNFKGKDRELGIVARIKVKKNRVLGRARRVDVPILHSFGIDDVGGCVDYLVDENHWPKTGGTINAKDFDFKGTKEEVVRHVEEEDLIDDLQQIVSKCWNAIEDACVVERRRRYD